MDALRDLYFVIFLLVALGIAWFLAGGPSNPLSREGPLLTAPWPLGKSTAFHVPSVQLGTPSNDTIQSSDGVVTTISNYLGTFNEIESPYGKYVTLEKSQAASDIKGEYLTLRVASNAPQKITVTGWRIESTASTLSMPLPQATELPFLGTVNSEGPVSLSPGQKAYIVTGRSPSGTSFRSNMCTGYFEQFQDFTPKLQLNCPSAEDEATRVLGIGDYTQSCYDFVRTLNRCQLYVNSIPASVPLTCQNFVHDKLTYNGCINDHKNDPKFYGSDWYLFLNRDSELWRQRSERIRLLDEKGKVVDVVQY